MTSPSRCRSLTPTNGNDGDRNISDRSFIRRCLVSPDTVHRVGQGVASTCGRRHAGCVGVKAESGDHAASYTSVEDVWRRTSKNASSPAVVSRKCVPDVDLRWTVQKYEASSPPMWSPSTTGTSVVRSGRSIWKSGGSETTSRRRRPYLLDELTKRIHQGDSDLQLDVIRSYVWNPEPCRLCREMDLTSSGQVRDPPSFRPCCKVLVCVNCTKDHVLKMVGIGVVRVTCPATNCDKLSDWNEVHDKLVGNKTLRRCYNMKLAASFAASIQR